MTLRSYECPRCGAPRQSLEDAVVTVCPYCGAIATVEVSAERHARWTEAAMAEIRRGGRSALQRRRDAVYRRIEEARKEKQRETWRAAMEELLLLDRALLEGPEAEEEDPERVLGEIRQSLAMQEVMTFDREVVRLQREAGQALASIVPEQDWSSGKPRRRPGWTVSRGVEGARAALAAWTRVYEAVVERTGDHAIVPAAFARDAVLNYLAFQPRMPGRPLSKREVREISEALAPSRFSESRRCAHCGAELPRVPAGEVVRCESCGTVSRRL